jgi:hypothetical protein
MSLPKLSDADKDKITNLYNEGNSTAEIGKSLGISSGTVASWMRRWGVPVRDRSLQRKLAERKINRRGANNSRWKGGRSPLQGYMRLLNHAHPRADSHGYVLEHILVWEKIHKRYLPKGWVVHHLNGIKDDNRPENLIALPTRKHRQVLQAKAKRIRELEILNSQLRRVLENNQAIFYIGYEN